ncbi:GntR family transcriptional regulator, partial [Nonomuraea aridisoli]
RDEVVTAVAVPSGLVQRARELLDEARRYGYGRDDLISILEELP